jgi:hypothetical protein
MNDCSHGPLPDAASALLEIGKVLAPNAVRTADARQGAFDPIALPGFCLVAASGRSRHRESGIRPERMMFDTNASRIVHDCVFLEENSLPRLIFRRATASCHFYGR